MDWKEKYVKMAVYFNGLMEGDDWMIEDAYKMMKEDGLVDEDGFWIYKEEDDL